jgi:exosortase
LSLGPLAAYAAPLWQDILADTPIAYLMWIPLLAIIWGAQELQRSEVDPGDAELDAILGVSLLLVTGAALVIGPARWPYFFVMDNGGLLLWPLWLLGMSWLLFGISVTPRLLSPAAYLLLAWPPLLSAVASLTQSVLVRIAIGAVTDLSRFLPWLQTQGQGTFLVAHGSTLVPVLVSNACSGADSAVGAAILLPVLLARLRGALWRKMLLVLAAIVGAVVLNVLRLAAIIAAIHYLGAAFALGVVHPSLGFVLFAFLAAILFGLLLHTGDVRSQLAVARRLHAWWEGPLIAISAGFAEEVTFRGYLLTGLRRLWPNATWLAVVLSSVGFALAHVAWGLQPLQFVFYIALGVLLAVGVLRSRSVWPAVVAHAGWDALAFLLLAVNTKAI